MLLDLIDLSKLRRAIVYGLFLALLFALQDLLVSNITIFGVKPMLIPAAVIAIGIYEGGLWGGIIGLAAGYFSDLGYTEQRVLFTVLFAAVGFFSGVMCKYLLHKGIVSFLAMFLLSMTVITLCQMFRFLFLVDTDTAMVWRTGLIQVTWSLPWAVPTYFSCKVIAGRAHGA